MALYDIVIIKSSLTLLVTNHFSGYVMQLVSCLCPFVQVITFEWLLSEMNYDVDIWRYLGIVHR